LGIKSLLAASRSLLRSRSRSAVSACPAAAPGGLSAFELRQETRILASHQLVRGVDITEIDASKDSDYQRTVRLAALLLLEALAGYLDR